jgi:signal transduction histidine kinase
LIVLPVAVMSIVGLLAIRRDRAVVEEEARRGAVQLVNQLALALATGLPRQLAAFDHFSDAWYQYHWELAREPRSLRQAESYATQLREWQSTNPGLDPETVLPNRVGFDRDGAMVWPPDYAEPPQTPPWVLGLTEQQRRIWDALSKAQYTDSSFTNLQSRVEEFLQTKPSGEARANAEFVLLRQRRGHQTTLQALQALKAFADKCRGFRSESGLPLLSLVEDAAVRAIREGSQPPAIFGTDPNDRGGYPGEVIGWALDEPSLLTPRFLRELESLFPDNSQSVSQFRPSVQSALTVWAAQERLHEIGEAVRRQGFLASGEETNFWLNFSAGEWFCRIARGEIASLDHDQNRTRHLSTNAVLWMRLYPSAVIDLAAARAIRESGLSIPEYVGLKVQLGSNPLALGQGHPFAFESHPGPVPWSRSDKPGRVARPGLYYLTATLNGAAGQSTTPILAEASGRFAALPISWSSEDAALSHTDDAFPQFAESEPPAEFKVQVGLVDPELLFAQQRQRTLLFGGVILASTLAACVGLAAAYRAFRRQLRLSELKSNFVSSVSHELRAPIASVRLMAESLEGNKIVDATKQHEYFRFIVQECRRLSSLIENVLDFSRIEQGRKQFEFEPTDIVALTTQTVKLMQAYATERQVALVLASADKVMAPHLQFVADGKAVQQALINLIDNAVKHSPKGETVTVGLEVRGELDPGAHQPETSARTRHSDRATLALWVEDRGEGIPESEHAKIFERFYRLGSELRRETQGVGIGLSIVKHVVEAHGGRVLINSAIGKGSKFTMELPLKGEQGG